MRSQVQYLFVRTGSSLAVKMITYSQSSAVVPCDEQVHMQARVRAELRRKTVDDLSLV